MSAPNDGGPAFPSPNAGEWGFNSKNERVFCPDVTSGMTLRDWFAGQVLAGLMADSECNVKRETAAKCCYDMADAMLQARDGH